jgi:UDP-N-acetylmuramoylalanine--D-glutamate ligase
MEYKGKKVTVVGLGRSGIGATNLLLELGAEVTVTDTKTRGELSSVVEMIDSSVRLSLGGHSLENFTSTDMIVVSPGVPLDIQPLEEAKAKGITVLSELELAYSVIQSTVSDRNIPFLAVTGSNGKSTTTTLLNHMLKRGGCNTIIGGNIGNALTEEIYKICKVERSKFLIQNIDFVVAEVSSFQLEAIDTFRPHVASILNITPDHLDRYHSMSEYVIAKSGIFTNQHESDYLVLNSDDSEVMKVRSGKLGVGSGKPRVLLFSRKDDVEGVYCRSGMIYCNMPQVTEYAPHFPLLAEEEIKIKGVHNLENAMAASAMALLAQCPLEAVKESLMEFEGLEHRLEFVRELNGVKYINDSKGTNIGAVTKSLESFKEQLILIAGGRDKEGDFASLRNLVTEKVKGLVLIGEASGKIKDALGDFTETVICRDLKDAVMLSKKMAESGDVVLLSPACTSFDMFRDFEDRGHQFKRIVEGLED